MSTYVVIEIEVEPPIDITGEQLTVGDTLHDAQVYKVSGHQNIIGVYGPWSDLDIAADYAVGKTMPDGSVFATVQAVEHP